MVIGKSGVRKIGDLWVSELVDDAEAESRKRMGLLDWAEKYRPLLIPDRPFDLDSHKYLKGIYECKAKDIVVFKASQMGISEYLLSYVLHGCDARNATCLYIFPTEGLISDFSTARLSPALEVSDYLKSIVHDHTGKDGKKGANRITLKRIRNRFLYLRGGQVKPDGRAPALKSLDVDCLVLDELDECDPRVKSIALKRLGHSDLAETRIVSTPTYPGIGIHAEWLLSDQREWFIKCEKTGCHHWQTVTMAQNVITEWDEDSKRPAEWHKRDGKAVAVCEKCHEPLTLLADGEWIATYPERPIAGFHVKKFFGPVCNLDGIIEGMRSYNQTTVRETYNQDCAETYVPEGGQLADVHLDAVRREYIHGVRPGKRCYMGIDVGSVLHCVIREEPDSETGERRQLFAGEVSWAETGRLIRTYNPITVVIDGLPETSKCRELQDDFKRGQVWLCYYGDGSSTNQRDSYARWNHKESTLIADRTRSLDEMYARIYEGISTLPGNARDIPRYYDQMKAPIRILEKNARGDSVAKWVEGSAADHFAHAEGYCALASLRVRSSATAGKLDY